MKMTTLRLRISLEWHDFYFSNSIHLFTMCDLGYKHQVVFLIKYHSVISYTQSISAIKWSF